ncbi:MAG: alpha/beta hydrolase [Defluviitaleaceae bacterium]|nr:alpha/beta hydrolase [Defluviitaleaceae bacterium]
MKIMQIPLWEKNQYNYHTEIGFVPQITTYLLEGSSPRPAVLIAPGGGYVNCSPREGEPVAMKFMAMGYHAIVLTYTVNPFGLGETLGLQPLRDIARAMILIRKNAEAWKIKPDGVAVCGFSAGGHLVGSLATLWNKEFLQDICGAKEFSAKPDAAIISYAILAGEHIATDPIINDLGTNIPELLALEKHIGAHTPPTFLWHTITDTRVPVEHSMIFAGELRKNNIPFEMHLFCEGAHGVSTADDEIIRYGHDEMSPTLLQIRKFIEYNIKIGNKDMVARSVRIGDANSWDEWAKLAYEDAGTTHNAPHLNDWIELCEHWLAKVFGG